MPVRVTEIKVPFLYGGISDQPTHVRHLNQVESARNVTFDVVDGMSKREGSRFHTEPSLEAGGDYRMHVISRDHKERYLVVFGQNDLRIWEVFSDGSGMLEATVNFDADALAYYKLGDPDADDIRMVTIADFTIILNTTVAVGTAASASFVITDTHPSLDVLLSNTPAVGTSHAVAPTSTTASSWHQYQPSESSTFATHKMDTVTGDAWATPGGEYNTGANIPGGFEAGFQRLNMDIAGGVWTASSKNLQDSELAGYAFRVGDEIKITGGSGVANGWYAIASKASDAADSVTLDKSIAGSNNTDTTSDAIGLGCQVIVDFQVTYASMDAVAEAFEDALHQAGCAEGLISWTPVGTGGGYFTLTSPFKGSAALVFDPVAPTGSGLFDYSASGRPFNPDVATNGTGTPTVDTEIVLDRWTKVGGPAQAGASPTQATLPIQLVRTSYDGDGSTPAEFTVSSIAWNDRTSGDNTTNPAPSVFATGQKITDVSFHRNRLVLVGGENVVFSQAGDFFNFYLDNASNLVDSDPIDISLSGEEVALIDFVVPFRNTLVIFTKAGKQFELSAPDLLTPASAAFNASTSYNALSIRPAPSGNFLYFMAARKDTGILYEYFFDDSRVSNSAANVSVHVQSLLPTAIRSLDVSTNNEMVFVVPLTCDKIYVYKSFWLSGSKKDQSAWTIWDFHDDYQIADIGVIRNDLYMLVEMDGKWTIESISVTRQAVISGA